MAEENSTGGFDLSTEIAEANAQLPIDLSRHAMPLDLQIRSIALTLAQRHTGDTVVREGNLYQHLKMDNKLAGPLTVEHVLHCALIFERFLWGEWSKGVAGEAMTHTLDEMDKAIKREGDQWFGDEEDPPTRPHSGGEP